MLSGLLTRTGILVRDLPHLVIFAQLGLQEYYASTDLMRVTQTENINRIAGEIWWREVILLAIAQQKEPTEYILKLFDVNPLLAAEAVAESPTPSFALQGRAVDSCLHAIDEQLHAARTATVSLLRKIRGALEDRMISELEGRLRVAESARTAGLVLAVAGTPAATAALERHPQIWGTCLQDAGFLSSSLENLLVRWIKDGDEAQCRHASDLLTKRLSTDRLEELVTLLPQLQPNKVGYVAAMLLKSIAESETQNYLWLRPNRLIHQVATCTVRLPPESRLGDFVRNGSSLSLEELNGCIASAVRLRSKNIGIDGDCLAKKLINAYAWHDNHGPLCFWIGATLILCFFGSPVSTPRFSNRHSHRGLGR